MKILDQIRNLLFGKKAEEAPPPKSPDQYAWPEDRELILQLLDSGDDFRARAQAVTLLPYPEERERIIRIAKEDRDDFVRDFAIEKLRYPDDRDVLAALAESETNYQLVRRAVEMLPWPEEKEELLKLARADNYPVFAVKKLDNTVDPAVPEGIALNAFDREARQAAAALLEYPRSKDALEQYVLSDDPLLDRRAAIEKLPYPECRETLVKAAASCNHEISRAFAVSRLPWPEEKELLETLAHSGEESFAKAAAMLAMARGGVCPACGKPVKNYTKTVYMNDDPNDVSKECEACLCEACGWEWVND